VTFCPRCERDYAHDTWQVERCGAEWQVRYCYWCGEDYVIPAEWDEWSAWCPGCGERADPAYERVGVLAQCENESCPVESFQPSHDWFDTFAGGLPGDTE